MTAQLGDARGNRTAVEHDLAWTPAIATWEVARAAPIPGARALSTAEASELIEQLRELDPGVLVLAGAERPDMDRLIGQAAASGLRITLAPDVTSSLTPAAARRFAALGVRRIAIGVDGPDASAHDRAAGIPGAFAAAHAAVAAVHAAGLTLEVVTRLDRATVVAVPRTAALVADLAPALWTVAFVVGPEAAGYRPLGPDACERVFDFLYEWGEGAGLAVETSAAPGYRRVVAQRDAARRGRRAARSRPLPLNDGKGLVFVSHTGDVYPSAVLPVSTANVRERGLADTYRTSRLFRALRDPLRLEGRCGACPFRALCGGSRARAYAATGNFLAADPACAYRAACQG